MGKETAMTKEEVCKKYDVSLASMEGAWPRTQKSILKKYGVYIEKIGRGNKATYEEVTQDNRAVTMYEEVKEDMIIDRSALKYESIEFHCFLAIITTQFMTFRGTYSDFVSYLGLKNNKANIEMIKEGIDKLIARRIIKKVDDTSTDEGYFILSLVRKAEKEMKIGLDMVRTCKQLAEKNKKKDYIPLLKTWLGIQVMSQNQPFKVKDLEDMTGLSSYQIRESKRILEQNEIFRTSRAYADYATCLGQKVELNAFYRTNLHFDQ